MVEVGLIGFFVFGLMVHIGGKLEWDRKKIEHCAVSL